ncbi:MAG: translation initiation factor [Bacteroidia bacterium]|nr:translation initiation factor [Bacteroidia bacterium]MBT8269660.1 translation initiation factor [Bacteroidia bacterium]NNF81408.1 translation initiation factor [Flavobacteriaceae bacterium]NNK70491.1 translation initiation factor [Flavobacteriaceae bacterium]NNL80719.1 translation initiation factor [Flavobacteriaceae bacterium]
MDLEDQLKQLFPDHVPEKTEQDQRVEPEFWLQDEPLLCKYEKRKGKPITIIDGYNGSKNDFKKLTQTIQRSLHVGGSCKGEQIFIQGNYRDQIMDLLKSFGFNVKRVGG